MKSMTLHKMDDVLVESIKALADEQGKSINAMMKELLAKAIGLEVEGVTKENKTGYQRFLGRWSAEENTAFERSTSDFELVDESDWTS